MLPVLLLSLAIFPLDPTREGCPTICCKAFEVACLACQLCMSAKEYCQKEPSTFGCKRIESSDDSGLDVDASNVTYEMYNGTHDVTVRFDQIKVNLSDAGFEIDGKLNPVMRVICNNTEDCDLQIEVVQQQPNKTCVVSFEDVSSDMTSDDMDFGFKEEDDGPIAGMQSAARDAFKVQLDQKIHGRLQQLSFMGEVPESGPKREKADRFADFLSKAREGRDAFMRGEQVMQKMVQTRKMKSNLKSTLTRMVSSCFDDTILEDTVTDAELEDTFVSYNTSKRRGDVMFKPGGLGSVDFEIGLPKRPSKPEGGWGDFKDIGFRFPWMPRSGGDGDTPSMPSGSGFSAPPVAPSGGGLPEGGGGGDGIPGYPLNRRKLSASGDTANGDGGVVPVDSPSPPSLPPVSPPSHSPPTHPPPVSPPVSLPMPSPVSAPSPPPSPPSHSPPTHPPPAHPKSAECISATSTISAMSGTYYIDGSSDAKKYGSGTFHLHITAGTQHPVRFKHEGGMSSCCPVMTAKPADNITGAGMAINLTSPVDSGMSYTYYYGNWEATFGADPSCHAHPMSLVCGYHGYMNAQSRLSWDSNCSQTESPHPPQHPPSPMPPPVPGSPSPPNQPPLEAAEYVVKFTATLSGTVDAFDQEAYKLKLANATGANASHIELTVTPASINVEARITTTSYSQASSVEDVLAPLESDISSASSLLGVTVESVQPVSIDPVASPPPPGNPPPSPSSPPPSSEDSNNMLMVSVIVAVAALAVVATAAVAMVWFQRKAAAIKPKAVEAKVDAVMQTAPLLSMKS
jgi:hypothetical protein